VEAAIIYAFDNWIRACLNSVLLEPY
jgi:hypothetical protein